MGIGTWTRIWSTLFIRMLLGRWADLRTTTLDYDVYQGQGYDVDFDMAQNMDQDVISHNYGLGYVLGYVLGYASGCGLGYGQDITLVRQAL